MILPERPTEDQILALIRFHESAIEYYAKHGQSAMEKWSREMAEEWRGKLKAPNTRVTKCKVAKEETS